MNTPNPDQLHDKPDSGTSSSAARPDRFIFFVNGTRYETDQEAMTGLQIKARVADWDQSHDLVLEGHGNEPDQIIADDAVVHLDTKHGPHRFSSVPKANFGCCQRRYKKGPTTGLKTGQLVQTKSLGLRLGIIGCGEAAVAERKPISRSR